MDAYLIRIPTATPLPDSVSAVRPGVVWTFSASCSNTSCDRLWLVAEHNGILKFRIRDDVLWSGWYPLPTNIATAGGASLIFFNGTIELYGCSTGGTVITTTLTSAINCAPVAYTWANWSVLPGSPVTDREPAAEVQGTIGPFVAVRRPSDGRILYAWRSAGTWSAWNASAGSIATNLAPALAYNPNDGSSGRMWLFVNNQATGVIHFAKINNNLNFGTWDGIKTAGVEPWGTAPQAIWDGTRVRVFVGKSPFPNLTYQITNDNTGWDTWAPIFSEGESTRQPVTALVNGDVDLITYWYTAGMSDQLVK